MHIQDVDLIHLA